ncbi:sulfatase-like hydrolase/transferase [Paenibacillus cymbidii]|uniref:sulfatase-like hydrolase/transferase n=1 Tax=Paenibacillus cymbidii TaxID=1639034 RepID=UPI00108036C1|nr:sulfatase-like hydrolase/transferase [Paenibacillus cymbidii]
MDGQSTRPNILLIMTDQQRCDSLGCYGSEFVRTPSLDRLAADGLLFTRAYCTNPVCTPSRVSLFTGMHVGSHGAWNIGTIAEDNGTFLSARLAEAGYDTRYVGKAHFSSWAASPQRSLESFHDDWERNFRRFPTPYYGFEHAELSMGHTSFGHFGHYGLWLREKLGDKRPAELVRKAKSIHRFGAEAYDWDMPVELHNSSWVAERTVHALREAKAAGKPFLIAASFQDPHHPHCLPASLGGTVDPSRVPPPLWSEGELDDKPPHFKSAHEGEHAYPTKAPFRTGKEYPDAFSAVEAEEAQLARAYYYAMVQLVDRCAGVILDELAGLGLVDNTIVVFTTDHGELLGDHGLWLKGPFHYEQLINVPLLLRWPAGLRRTGVCASLASLADLAPTLLEAAGQQVPGWIDGHSLMPLLRNEQPAVRQHAFIEYVDTVDDLRLKTVVTERYKLTVYHRREYGELYDLREDPRETVNLFHAPAMQQVKMRLMALIVDEMEKPESKLRRPRIGSS